MWIYAAGNRSLSFQHLQPPGIPLQIPESTVPKLRRTKMLSEIIKNGNGVRGKKKKPQTDIWTDRHGLLLCCEPLCWQAAPHAAAPRCCPGLAVLLTPAQTNAGMSALQCLACKPSHTLPHEVRGAALSRQGPFAMRGPVALPSHRRGRGSRGSPGAKGERHYKIHPSHQARLIFLPLLWTVRNE